jgi:hypothetical protein
VFHKYVKGAPFKTFALTDPVELPKQFTGLATAVTAGVGFTTIGRNSKAEHPFASVTNTEGTRFPVVVGVQVVLGPFPPTDQL